MIQSKIIILRLLLIEMRLYAESVIFMLKRFAALLIVVLAFGVLFSRAQDAGDTIKIDTRLVSVPVIVSDRNGHYVPNLTAADFTVLQDGSPQNIEFFATTEEPLTVALLIDSRQSTW